MLIIKVWWPLPVYVEHFQEKAEIQGNNKEAKANTHPGSWQMMQSNSIVRQRDITHFLLVFLPLLPAGFLIVSCSQVYRFTSNILLPMNKPVFVSEHYIWKHYTFF